MKWGTIVNSCLLTANISFRRTGREYSLSAILEEVVDEKYYLSEKSVKGMITHAKNQEKMGRNFKTNVIQKKAQHSLQVTTKDGVVEEQ